MPAEGRSQNLKLETSSRRHEQRMHPYQGKGGTANRWRVIYRAVCVALSGTVFMLMVQGDVLVTDWVTPPTLLEVGLTFVLPFGASTYSMVSSSRSLRI